MATTKDSASISHKISTLAEDVDKELTCAICLSRYETPKVLPCLHTYCKGCLGDLLTKSREPDRVTCPQCKEEHNLPEDGVDGFKTYFTINNLLELLQVGLIYCWVLASSYSVDTGLHGGRVRECLTIKRLVHSYHRNWCSHSCNQVHIIMTSGGLKTSVDELQQPVHEQVHLLQLCCLSRHSHLLTQHYTPLTFCQLDLTKSIGN